MIQRGPGACRFLAQSCQAKYTAGDGTRLRVPVGQKNFPSYKSATHAKGTVVSKLTLWMLLLLLLLIITILLLLLLLLLLSLTLFLQTHASRDQVLARCVQSYSLDVGSTHDANSNGMLLRGVRRGGEGEVGE